MLLARTPMKPAGDVCEDVPKPVKWLRCLQCNQKFPEDRFREHQRESKSPCELVRKHDGIVTRPDGATPLPNELHVMSRLHHASHTLGHGNRVCVSPTRAFSRRRLLAHRPFARPRHLNSAARAIEATPGAIETGRALCERDVQNRARNPQTPDKPLLAHPYVNTTVFAVQSLTSPPTRPSVISSGQVRRLPGAFASRAEG